MRCDTYIIKDAIKQCIIKKKKQLFCISIISPWWYLRPWGKSLVKSCFKSGTFLGGVRVPFIWHKSSREREFHQAVLFSFRTEQHNVIDGTINNVLYQKLLAWNLYPSISALSKRAFGLCNRTMIYSLRIFMQFFSHSKLFYSQTDSIWYLSKTAETDF